MLLVMIILLLVTAILIPWVSQTQKQRFERRRELLKRIREAGSGQAESISPIQSSEQHEYNLFTDNDPYRPPSH